MTYYNCIGPFGDRRADAQAALIAQTIANVNREKTRDPYTLDEFMLKMKTPEVVVAVPNRKQTPEEQFAIFEAVRITQNAQWEKAHATG